MVFFLPFSTDWSVTSNFLTHAWVEWATRGLCKYSWVTILSHSLLMTTDTGYRRAMLNTQSEYPKTFSSFFLISFANLVSWRYVSVRHSTKFDLMSADFPDSETPIYNTGVNFRVASSDVSHHITVMKTVNKKLPAGSNWFMEIGHNGNGNIEVALSTTSVRTRLTSCSSRLLTIPIHKVSGCVIQGRVSLPEVT